MNKNPQILTVLLLLCKMKVKKIPSVSLCETEVYVTAAVFKVELLANGQKCLHSSEIRKSDTLLACPYH